MRLQSTFFCENQRISSHVQGLESQRKKGRRIKNKDTSWALETCNGEIKSEQTAGEIVAMQTCVCSVPKASFKSMLASTYFELASSRAQKTNGCQLGPGLFYTRARAKMKKASALGRICAATLTTWLVGGKGSLTSRPLKDQQRAKRSATLPSAGAAAHMVFTTIRLAVCFLFPIGMQTPALAEQD